MFARALVVVGSKDCTAGTGEGGRDGGGGRESGEQEAGEGRREGGGGREGERVANKGRQGGKGAEVRKGRDSSGQV